MYIQLVGGMSGENGGALAESIGVADSLSLGVMVLGVVVVVVVAVVVVLVVDVCGMVVVADADFGVALYLRPKRLRRSRRNL